MLQRSYTLLPPAYDDTSSHLSTFSVCVLKMTLCFIFKSHCKVVHISRLLQLYRNQKLHANAQTVIFHCRNENHFPPSQKWHPIQCVSDRHSPSVLRSLSQACRCSSYFLPLSGIDHHTAQPTFSLIILIISKTSYLTRDEQKEHGFWSILTRCELIMIADERSKPSQ